MTQVWWRCRCWQRLGWYGSAWCRSYRILFDDLEKKKKWKGGKDQVNPIQFNRANRLRHHNLWLSVNLGSAQISVCVTPLLFSGSCTYRSGCAPWTTGSWRAAACTSDTAQWSSGSTCCPGCGGPLPPGTLAPTSWRVCSLERAASAVLGCHHSDHHWGFQSLWKHILC